MSVLSDFPPHAVLALACFLSLSTLQQTAAQADSPVDRHQVKIKPMFAFAGETEGEWEGGASGKIEHDNLATLGVGASYEYPLHRYVTVGGLFAFYSFNTEELDDDKNDRSTGLSFDVLIRGRYPLVNDRLELYAQLPVGLSVTIPNSDFEDYQGVSEAVAGVSWNIALEVGAQYFFTDSIGALVELGWVHRGVSFELEYSGGGKNGEFSGASDQFALNVGVVLAF